MPRIVLDTSVLVAASRSRNGASYALLVLVQSGAIIKLLATPALFLQWEDVLMRPDQLAASGMTTADVEAALRDLAALVEPVEIRYGWRPQLIDPGDELVLEAAVNGRADAIVTFNVRHFAAAAERFGIPVMTPREMLEGLRR